MIYVFVTESICYFLIRLPHLSVNHLIDLRILTDKDTGLRKFHPSKIVGLKRRTARLSEYMREKHIGKGDWARMSL